MHFGAVLLPEHRWPEGRGLWQQAEQMGFEHLWTYDHLSWRTLRDGPWFAALPTLVAAATATGRARLGPLVASPNFRHPLTLAKELVALDDISGGRAVAGLGAGGTGFDATALGQGLLSPADRASRFEEFVQVLDLLLTEPAASWSGQWYTVDEGRVLPGCTQQPRLGFAIAAAGRRTLRLAARYGDYWVTYGRSGCDGDLQAPGPGAAAVARECSELDEECASAGRQPGAVRRMVLTGLRLAPAFSSPGELEDMVGHYEAAGVTDLVFHWPRPGEPFRADRAAFERSFGAVLGTSGHR
jgi:alkanesulfonate monooxygenase SsuD/methylene tetrahydromethanopterin reductase-like flavin-dependent oxidoreductase (luciferase family)